MTQEWYSEENLQQAWKFVKTDIRDDFVFDIIDFDDIRYNLSQVISSLHAQIKSNQYYPVPVIRIGVPKNFHSVRPGTVIPPIDLIVLYSIAQQLAPLLDVFLSDSAFAYRLNPRAGKSGEHLFKDKEEPKAQGAKPDDKIPAIIEKASEETDFPYNWFINWKAFHELSKEASKEYEYVAVTDITAFFENISLDLLREILKEKLNTSERELIDRLFRTLEFWSWTPDGNLPRGIGLLQGNDVSSFISNLYLLDLDVAMLDVVGGNQTKYYRYVDDVKLFTSDQDEARRALVRLEEVLRKLNLNVQSAKTKIVPADEVFDPVVDLWLERMGDDSDDKTDAAIKFFETVFNANELERWQRPYSRCLTVLRNANDDRAVDTALKLFLTNPSHRLLTRNFTYLHNFATSHKYGVEIANRLAESTFTFPYHRAYIFRLAAYSRDEILPLREMALKEAIDSSAHWFCRTAASFCLSTFALNKSELAQIETLINLESNPQVMRAVYVTLLQHSGNELRWVLDKLTLFNAPHQDYLRRYFFQLYKDTTLAKKHLEALGNISLTAPTFIHSYHRLDLLKASSNAAQRTAFKKVVEKMIQECESADWPRISNRLHQIYETFIVKA
jgi:retron-type reverse transcriptase